MNFWSLTWLWKTCLSICMNKKCLKPQKVAFLSWWNYSFSETKKYYSMKQGSIDWLPLWKDLTPNRKTWKQFNVCWNLHNWKPLETNTFLSSKLTNWSPNYRLERWRFGDCFKAWFCLYKLNLLEMFRLDRASPNSKTSNAEKPSNRKKIAIKAVSLKQLWWNWFWDYKIHIIVTYCHD